MRHLPIASDGWRFIIPLWVAGLGLALVSGWYVKSLGILILLLAAFVTGFFRDFNRPTVLDPNLIYSPGDGKILEAGAVSEGPYAGWTIVRIFLSVFDVHVQRSPVSGRVKELAYQKGLFLDARDPDAHFRNEQNSMTVISENGPVIVKQIAGLIARRIVCWAKAGDQLTQGARYGLIRFGSQVDIFFPANAELQVSVGDKVVGGLTVLAKWKK